MNATPPTTPSEIPVTPTTTNKQPFVKLNKKIIILAIVLLLFTISVGVGAFVLRNNYKNPTSDSALKEEQEFTTGFNIKENFAFAQYTEVPSTVIPSLESYTLKSSELTNLSAVEEVRGKTFTQGELTRLETDGFFVKPLPAPKTDSNDIIDGRYGGRTDDMIDLYDEIGGEASILERKPENAIFVTSDLLLHVYHLLISRSFKEIEQKELYPRLHGLTKALFEKTAETSGNQLDSKIKESNERLTAYFLVPLAILDAGQTKSTAYFNQEEQVQFDQADENADSRENIFKKLATYSNQVSPEVYKLAEAELKLVLSAESPATSPLFGKFKEGPEDYTQYKPRSYYSTSSLLRTYFRSLMWYGRQGFYVKNIDSTRDAVLMTYLMNSTQVEGKPALQIWEEIYAPTVFFVGQSDDLTFYNYLSLAKEVWGDNFTTNSISDETKISTFQQKAHELEGPKILSEIIIFDPTNTPSKSELLQSTKSFRFMGQRFIPDSYIFSTLTQGQEKPDQETGQSLPSTPTGLMAMSVFGSKKADDLLAGWVSQNAPSSDKVINKFITKLKQEFSGLDLAIWTQNIYWAWIYNFLPLFEEHNEGYPMFMRSALWANKSLQSVFGSWTELRHDTILYAKQSYAEMGGGPPEGEIPPVPKGYVEPNLAFLTRLIALNNMTKEGLDSRKLLLEGYKAKYELFTNTLEFFKSFAEKELANTTISDEDYEKLRKIDGTLGNIVWPIGGDLMTERDARVALIADVHTDALKNQILYEAIGYPSLIYVAIKDNGGTRLTRGITYSYYEFTEPLGGRLTDETWQARIYEGLEPEKVPPQPQWTNELLSQ